MKSLSGIRVSLAYIYYGREALCKVSVERSTCLLLIRHVRLKPVCKEDPFLGTKLGHHGIVTSNAATNAFILDNVIVRDE